MIKKVEGIVIQEVPYKENSKIITLFSRENGLIGIYARGAKKLKSPFSGKTSKLTYGYFHIHYKEDGLSTLIEVDVIDPLKNIRKDLTKICYVSFLSELASQVYRHDNNAEIYSLYMASILKINNNYDPLVISNILELKLLYYLGINPVIDKCVECGSTKDIVTVSSYKGGYLCKNCFHEEPIVLDKTIKMLRLFYYVDISAIQSIHISDQVKFEINRFLDEYYERYAGLYLKSKDFLKKIHELGIKE